MAVRDVVQAAAGAGGGDDNLYVEDVFSTYLYTGNGTGQIIGNGIALGDSNFGGSGVFSYLDYLEVTPEVIGAGDFTIEFWVNHNTITYYQTAYVQGYGMAGSFIVQTGNSDGKWKVYIDASVVLSETTSTVNTNTWYHIAITRSGSTIRLFRDGVQTGSGTSSVDINFSGAASISYPTAEVFGHMSNFRYVKGTALYTSAFTPPTSALTAISGTKLLTLQGDTPFLDNSTNALSITNAGTVSASKVGPYTEAGYGQGGMVWLKSRSHSDNHGIFDAERGVSKYLIPNTTGAEGTASGVSGFNSSGFSLGNVWNDNNKTYASWSFRKAPKFFDVVTWTGDDTTNRTHAHNLGSVPGLIIVKATSRSSNWTCYHRSLGNTQGLSLNSTDAAYSTTAWNSTSPTDSVFTATSGAVNEGGQTYVAYLFAHDAGGFGDDGEQNVISCGSYTGNDSYKKISLGFEPQMVIVKAASGTYASGTSWRLFDNMRGGWLYPNSSTSENGSYTYSDRITYEADGFSFNDNQSEINKSSHTYIYIAIRRGPMKTPTSGTEVFSTSTSSSLTANIDSGFVTDMVMTLDRSSSGVEPYDRAIFDRLRGNFLSLSTASLAGVTTNGSTVSFQQNNGIYLNGGSVYGNGYVYQQFARAPGFFDMVTTPQTAAGAGTVTHNLGVAPEFIILKGSDLYESWRCYHAATGRGAAIQFSSSEPYLATNYWGTADPTATEFGVHWAYYSGSNYIAYLFATLPGVSKVGSYTGNGSTQAIDCGFSNGARFVLIKRTDPGSTGDWMVWDTARGIVSGNDPRIALNTTDPEYTGGDYLLVPSASGFTVAASSLVNLNNASFIFLAIA